MKKPFICLCAGVVLFTLAECTTDYIMTTKSGQTVTTQDKPKLDKDTGMISYTDQDGNAWETNSNDVAQLIEANQK